MMKLYADYVVDDYKGVENNSNYVQLVSYSVPQVLLWMTVVFRTYSFKITICKCWCLLWNRGIQPLHNFYIMYSFILTIAPNTYLIIVHVYLFAIIPILPLYSLLIPSMQVSVGVWSFGPGPGCLEGYLMASILSRPEQRKKVLAFSP